MKYPEKTAGKRTYRVRSDPVTHYLDKSCPAKQVAVCCAGKPIRPRHDGFTFNASSVTCDRCQQLIRPAEQVQYLDIGNAIEPAVQAAKVLVDKLKNLLKLSDLEIQNIPAMSLKNKIS